MMRALATIAAVMIAGGTAHADRSVNGRVVDSATGAPVVGALVSVGTGEAGSDDAGRFTIGGLGFGRLDVVVIADGYRAYFGSARIGAVELVIEMTAETGHGEVIRVSGRLPSKPPLHLGTDEIRNLPGAGNDALRALQSLPGVARTPFGLGGLALRGTAPRDTKVYLDGIEVPLLYHFGGLASFLPTAAVDDLTLYPGGSSVRYGRGLGGVATVTSRTGRRDKWRVGAEMSLIHAASIAEGPGPLDGSWVIGVRRSYFDAIMAAARVDLTLVPRYGDAQLRWESGDGRWMAILFGSDDKLTLTHDPNDDKTAGIKTTNVKEFSYVSRFARLGLRYRAVRGATQVTILPSIGIDDVNGRAIHNDVDKGLHRTTIPVALRADVSTPLLAGTLTVGFDGGGSSHYYKMHNTPPPTPADPMPSGAVERELRRFTADTGAFIEQSWMVFGDRLEIRPGVRGDHFGLSDQWTLDPRILIQQHLPHGIELSQSAGVYHEPPLITDMDPVFGSRRMLGSKAYQVALGAKAIIGDASEIGATAYYQDLRLLPVDAVSGATAISDNGSIESGGALAISRELVDAQFGSYSYRESIGTGHAYGIEFIARRNTGKWTGWVAYTYGRSFRRNPIRGNELLPYVLDQPHTLTLLGTAALPRNWRVGGRFRYATGNPFTPIAGTMIDMDGDTVPIDGPLLSERLPDFFQLDVRVDHAWRRKWGVLNLYIDVQNVTNRRNAEGVTYSSDFSMRSYSRGLPIFPSIGVEYIP